MPIGLKMFLGAKRSNYNVNATLLKTMNADPLFVFEVYFVHRFRGYSSKEILNTRRGVVIHLRL